MKASLNANRLFSDFYRGKSVLVTGAAGVKAAWLLQLLEASGASLTGMDIKQPEATSNFVLSGLGKRIRFVQGDVADFGLMKKLLDEHDCVFHLASLVLVHDCKMRPLEAFRTNTFGTATVLEAFRLSSTAKYGVFVTTDKVYAPKTGLWVESDPLFATGPYAVSKACAEQIIADYGEELAAKGKRFGTGRAGNVLVGGDFYSSRVTNGAGRIFVDCFEALIDGKPPEIFSPSFTRPYIYGLDVVTGYLSLMARLDEEGVHRGAFNFGPHEQGGIPNALLATKICEEWGSGVMWQSGKPRSEPFATQALSWEKARQRLGWMPAYTLYEGIRDSAEWYRGWAKVKGAPHEGVLQELNSQLVAKHMEAAKRLGVWWASDPSQA